MSHKPRILLSEIGANWEAFQEIHKHQYVSSSRIAAIAGLNPYCSPLQVWGEMTAKLPHFEGNDHTWLGQKLEPIIAEMFSRRTLKAITKNDCIFQHPELDFAIATPDYFGLNDEERFIVECKATGARSAKAWDDNIPDAAHCQVQWQMGVCGDTKTYIAALIGGNAADFVIREVNFEPEIFAQLIGVAEKFLRLVRDGVPPEPQAGDSKLIDTLYSWKEGAEISLNGEVSPVLAEYLTAKDAHKKAGDEEKLAAEAMKRLENKLKMAMGGAERAVIGNHILQNKKVTRASYTTKETQYFQLKVMERKDG